MHLSCVRSLEKAITYAAVFSNFPVLPLGPVILTSSVRFQIQIFGFYTRDCIRSDILLTLPKQQAVSV